MPVYEMTPERFDGSSDATDGLIVWVKAPSLKAAVEYGKKTGFEGKIDLISDWAFARDCGIDVKLDAKGNKVR